MNLNEYVDLALRTCTLKGRQFELEHAGFGMMTEAGELADAFKKEMIYGRDIDIVNLKEEVGDCLWYAALASYVLETGLTRFNRRTSLFDPDEQPTSFELAATLVGSAAAFCGSVGEFDPAFNAVDVAYFFDAYMDTLRFIAQRYGFTLEEAGEINIAKLKARYPEGFTAERALNRNLDAERAVLEAGTVRTVGYGG
jgi:hypothetical protein